MAQQQLSTNTFTASTWIVNSDATKGTHTTLASALTSASSGDTILLQTSVTENPTLKAGVDIVAWNGSQQTPSVTITGTCTLTAAGTVSITGIRLQTNSAALLAVTGSAASIINLRDCYLNCTNNTGITFSSSSGSAEIRIDNCYGDLGTTGIGLFSHSSAGTLKLRNCAITNSGASTTASTVSAGALIISNSGVALPITSSSTGAITFEYSNFDISSTNTTVLTAGGSGTQLVRYCRFASGTASALSISTTLVMDYCEVNSTNTNSVTGAGTLDLGPVTFTGSSSKINTSTITPLISANPTNTFVPTVDGAVSGTTTYNYHIGEYTVVGNIVFYQFDISVSAATGTGNLTIGNFPFTVVNTTNQASQGSCRLTGLTWPVGSTMLTISPSGNTTTALITASGTASAGGAVQMANTAFILRGTGFYFTS